MPTKFVFVGAIYIDTILSVPRFPREDEKLRAAAHSRRRGGNCGNTLEVLSQLVSPNAQCGKEGEVELYLISVLPENQSIDVQFIKNSLLGVEIDNVCIYRENFNNAAASYIIQAADKSSRTIVSHNPLPEMTIQEFIDRANRIHNHKNDEEEWYHFEGRIPVVNEQSVRWLRKEIPTASISVECEKPDRQYMLRVAAEADVVFFSKLWAKAKTYSDPRSFLDAQLPNMRPGAILVCTWGSSGATCVRKRTHEGEDNDWATVEAWKPATGLADVVDTVGAGDTFIAGFLYAMSSYPEWSLRKQLEFANELAGRKVLQAGFEGLSSKMGVKNPG